MVLVHGIAFSHLAAQLIDPERAQFINNLAVSHPELIIQALTTYFIHQSIIKQDSDSYNAVCKQYISSIIQSRNTADIIALQSTQTKLDTIPQPVIGVCGSYLDQQSFSAFSLCNRAVYLGCKNPAVLTEMRANYEITTAEPVGIPRDFSSFPFATRLKLVKYPDRFGYRGHDEDLSLEVQEQIASQIPKMSRLRTLAFCNPPTTFCQMIASRETTNQRIQELYVQYFEDYYCGHWKYIEAITSFKHVQYLALNLDRCYRSVEQSGIDLVVETFDDLKGLMIWDCGSGIAAGLLMANSHPLQFLAFEMADDDLVVMLKNLNFVNLKQLKIERSCACRWNILQNVLQTANDLEKVVLSVDTQKIAEWAKVIRTIFEKCKNLCFIEILEVDTRDYGWSGRSSPLSRMDIVLDAIQCGLRAIKQPKETLKIKFEGFANLDECSVIKFRSMANSLLVSEVKHWMIILESWRCRNVDICSKILNSSDAKIFEDKQSRFVIMTNPKCNISGYRESWLMRRAD